MRQQAGAGLGGAVVIVLAAALLAAAGDAEARGGRRGGSSIGKAAARAESERSATSSGTHLNIRTGRSSSGNDSAPEAGEPSGRVRAVLPGAAPAREPDPEELARRAAALASYEKHTAEHAARKAETQRAEADRAEAQRGAAEKLDAHVASQRAAAERDEAARQTAELEKKKRERSVQDAEVELVLERARNDHPVLRTPEGEPILRAIIDRQKVLQARGMYPSVAMVEAVADHTSSLRARARPEPKPEAPAAAPDYSRTYGNCRWVTPYEWGCSK